MFHSSTSLSLIPHFGQVKPDGFSISSQTDTHFMHNGMLYGIQSYQDKTDSEFAFEHFLQPVIKEYGLQSEELGMEVDNIIGYSKFAFMQGEEAWLFGDFILRDGLFFSNLRFL